MDQSNSLHQRLSDIFASKPGAILDPFPTWNELREHSPVFDLGDSVLVSRHADVRSVLMDQRFLSNTKGKGSQFEAIRARLSGKELAALDDVTAFEANYVSRSNGDAHSRLRRVAQRTFMPQRIAALKERIQFYAEKLTHDMTPGTAFDLKPLAYRLPLQIIGELLEIPDDDLEQIHKWSSAIGRNRGGTDTPALMEAHKALGEFRAYMEGVIADVRAGGSKGKTELGVVAQFMDAEQDERLSTVELVAMFVILLFAGHETTTNLIASGVHQLLAHGHWDELAADPSAIPGAVEELVRFVAPTQFAGRVASEDLVVGGETIDAGKTIFLILAAANRDPSVFTNPDKLDIRRTDTRGHVGFGTGPHLCIGLHLARMEAVVTLEVLLKRFPKLELAPAELRFGGHAMLRGLVDLPVRIPLS